MSENLPVPVPEYEPPATVLASQDEVSDAWTRLFGHRPFVSSIDPKRSAADKGRLLATMNSKPSPAREWINLEFDLVDRTIYPARKVLPDGQVVEWIGTVLETADGKRIGCGSKGVLKSLGLIEYLGDTPPWHPPLRVRLVSDALPGGKQWYRLELVREEIQAERKKR